MADSASVAVHLPSIGRRERLRFRASRSQALFIVLPFCLIVAAQIVGHVWLAGRAAGGARWLYLVAAAMFLAAMCAQAWFGATLTTEGVKVHSFRPRTISWQDVTAIRAEESETNRVVAIYEFGHRRTRLHYPTTGALFRDAEFDEKLKIIQDWWAGYSA